MSTIQISNQTPFGGMTNRMVASILSNNTSMLRLKEAIATANAGYEGVAGVQFEDPQGLFGVKADPSAPGVRGSDYAYAMDSLSAVWATFWEAAQPYLKQLDNGSMSM
jgi:hypothetical protein